MISPEMAAMNSIDKNREHRVELSPTMENAYARAKKILVDSDYGIQEKEFEGVYDAGTIERDIALTNRLETKFNEERSSYEKNSKKIADVFESILLMQTEMNEWLGQNASTLKASRYDDYVNKVDMVAEWSSPEEGSRVLALAVDVTFGVKSIEKKMMEIRSEIEKGQLGSIRYFRDQQGDLMGTRKNVARTVIGISQPVIEQLAALWLENKNKALGEHPIQRLIIDQIQMQLSAMERYAIKLGRPHVAQSYRQALIGITKIKHEKAAISAASFADDPVAQEITLQTRKQFA